jgi:predicted lipid-binding transport protein (Tim44 family)
MMGSLLLTHLLIQMTQITLLVAVGETATEKNATKREAAVVAVSQSRRRKANHAPTKIASARAAAVTPARAAAAAAAKGARGAAAAAAASGAPSEQKEKNSNTNATESSSKDSGPRARRSTRQRCPVEKAGFVDSGHAL